RASLRVGRNRGRRGDSRRRPVPLVSLSLARRRSPCGRARRRRRGVPGRACPSADAVLADKDESTEEHTRRVALLAVQVGEELGLPPGRLRAIAIGGLLHDIGKLSVPERILKKPAALSDDEYD